MPEMNAVERANDFVTTSEVHGEPVTFGSFRKARQALWDQVALKLDRWRGWGGTYHRRLSEIYRFLIPPGQRILEIGCGQGSLLGSLNPAFGVGIDFSEQMVKRARRLHPEMHFMVADAHELPLNTEFDYIILSDLLNDAWDVISILEQIKAASPRARLIINIYSHLWQLPLTLAQKLGVAKPSLAQNWLTPSDIADLLYLSDYDSIKTWPEITCPLPIPLLEPLCNRFLGKLWPFSYFSMTNFVVARPKSDSSRIAQPLVSVIVPARNEAGNIQQIFSRVPEMGGGVELVFVEGHSDNDRTFEVIQAAIDAHPERRAKLFKQKGVGKGDAVRLGFAEASGDILMILDADLSVAPEELPRFCEALMSNKGEFINGVRLVYPMEEKAMQFFNLVGNKFFSLAFSWLLQQPIKDTLCGTKVMWKSDYDRIAADRSYFGDFDPFGDFDLIFGAAKQQLKMVDVPIRYRSRTYGTTNINRWGHGWLLMKMVVFAARRIRFV